MNSKMMNFGFALAMGLTVSAYAADACTAEDCPAWVKRMS